MNKHAQALEAAWKHYLNLARQAGDRFYRHANCKWVLHDINHADQDGPYMTVRTFVGNPHYILATLGQNDSEYPGYAEFHDLVERNPCPTGIELWEDYKVSIRDLPDELRSDRSVLIARHVARARIVEYQKKVATFLGLTNENSDLASLCAVRGRLNIHYCWWWPRTICNEPPMIPDERFPVIDRFPLVVAA